MATDFPERDEHVGPDAPSAGAPVDPDPGSVPLLPPGEMRPLPGQLETAPDGSIRPASIGDPSDPLDPAGLAGAWSTGPSPHEFSPPAPGLIDDAPLLPVTEEPHEAGPDAAASAPAWAATADIANASIGDEDDTERAAWPTVEPRDAGAAPQPSTLDQAPAATATPAAEPSTDAEPPPAAAPLADTYAPLEDSPKSPQTIVRPPEEATSGKDMYDVPLGTLVYRSGLLGADQIESALAESERIGKRLGEVLIDSKMIDERDLGRLLAGQKGLPFLDLGQMQIEPDATDLLPAASARIYCALPIAVNKGTPVVAVSDPTNGLVVEGVRRAMGGELSFAVATRSDLQRAIANHYGEDAQQRIGGEAVEPSTGPAFAASHDVPAATQQTDDAAPPVEAESEDYTAASDDSGSASSEADAGLVGSLLSADPPEASLPVAELDVPQPTPRLTPVVAATHEPVLPVVSAVEKTVRVIIRLTDGNTIDAGGFASTDQAIERARALIDSIEGKSGVEWPFLSGRFLRPQTIVSIDLVDEPSS